MIKIDETPKMWIYHQKECVDGKIVTVEEGETIVDKNGWCRTPNDFLKVQTDVVGQVSQSSIPKSNVSHETKKV